MTLALRCSWLVGIVLIALAVAGIIGGVRRSLHSRTIGPFPPSIEASVALLIDNSVVATVDENFVCATLDWWPPAKCDYGSCSWAGSSVLDLDLGNTKLLNAVEALSPLLIRIGGSLEDQVIYDVGNASCSGFFRNDTARFGFSGGCLSRERWDQLNTFMRRTGSLLAFGLNSLRGRKLSASGEYTGSWDPTNARDFISYTVTQGFKITAWEFGNEISGGAGVTLDPKQYAEDVNKLAQLIDEAYNAEEARPLLVAPDGFFNADWYSEFLAHTKRTDVVSIHVYNLGPGDRVGMPAAIMRGSYDPVYLQLQRVLSRNGARVRAWVGESGGAYNGGKRLVSDTFVNSFWYLDQLGTAALHNTAAFCRQTLVGGNYGLLGSSLDPNPDFYAAFLWKKLMGTRVLQASTSTNTTDLHTYAHCSKGSSNSGSITAAVINFSDRMEYSLHHASHSGRRLEYHLTASFLQSPEVLLNGKAVKSRANRMSALNPVEMQGNQPSMLAPRSIAFITFPDALVPACIL